MPDQLPLFVYGSLVRGGQYHAEFIDGRYARVEPGLMREYRKVKGSHGWFVAEPCAGSQVAGELFFFHPARYEESLARCDELEELSPGELRGAWYQREAVRIATDTGEYDAWAYTSSGQSDSCAL